MRKADTDVREVVCSETGKPMPKIPLWMADIKVKFVSDEARQKHPTMPVLMEAESSARSLPADEIDSLKALGMVDIAADAPEEFEETEADAEEGAEDDFEA